MIGTVAVRSHGPVPSVVELRINGGLALPGVVNSHKSCQLEELSPQGMAPYGNKVVTHSNIQAWIARGCGSEGIYFLSFLFLK
jgi:hypothetical protein